MHDTNCNVSVTKNVFFLFHLAKKLKTAYSSSFNDFVLSVKAMHRTVQALDTLLESLGSNISNELDKKSEEIKVKQ